ncbi:MAG: hypothetical protein LBV18_00805 [Alistipes sp.]|jgi:hypothetical protein|nr:hypothetical protein [Alistipes sp.]
MKKFLTLAAAAACTAAMFASCQKDAGNGTKPQEDNTPRTVALKMVYPETDGTRATGATPVTTADYIDFTSGHIFFVNTASFNIEKHVGIGNSAGSVQVVDVQDFIDAEVVIAEVPAAADAAILIANEIPSGAFGASGITGNLEGTLYTDIIHNPITVISLNDAAGTVDNVPIFSADTTVERTAGATPVGEIPFDATVTLPLTTPAARIEIASISAVPVTIETAGVTETFTVTDFTVEGIYINNYFPVSDIQGAYGENVETPRAVYNNGIDPANYATTGTTQYVTGNAIGLADLVEEAAVEGSVVSETGVWAYNIFGGIYAATSHPHIVIKISSFTYEIDLGGDVTERTVSTPRFLTVTGFTNSATDTHIASIANGTVYSFADLTFDYTNLSPIPEPGTEYAVQAIVTVTPWKVVNVTPEY